MFDKLLCKRIHKKEISLTDIGKYLANKFMPILMGVLVIILSCGFCIGMYDIYKTDIETFMFLVTLIVGIVIMIGAVTLWCFSDEIIIARCPNAKETEEEKKE